MKTFKKVFLVVTILVAAVFLFANLILLNTHKGDSGRPYRVEINRLVSEIEKDSFELKDLENCEYVTGVTKYGEDFYNTDSDYVVREINGELYRFDYEKESNSGKTDVILIVNTALAVMAVLIVLVLLYVRPKILLPFEKLTDVPYELSKGNLVTPVKEEKNRFFGRFVWGIDMLRENLEQQKERELSLQREKKMLLLSLSHDIKTPLSAIKLYSKALSKGLYDSREKQLEIAESINAKADQIENYVTEIITAAREDFLSLDVNVGEFYLSELITGIKLYYSEKLELIKTHFEITEYTDCILSGDLDRSAEVLQNIMENAVKYGDGRSIEISFSEDEGYILVTVKNSGNTLPSTDLHHIFESFWRGENAENKKGSGLGLYICRQLMNKMGGEIFAEIDGGFMSVTAVFKKV